MYGGRLTIWLALACLGCSDATQHPPVQSDGNAGVTDTTVDVGRPDPSGATPGGRNLDDVTQDHGAAGLPGSAGAGAGAMTDAQPDDPPDDVQVAIHEVADEPGTLCGDVPTDLARHSAHCGACDARCQPFVLATGPRWPIAIALNATHVYWVTGGNEGALMRVALSGGEPAMLAVGQSFPQSIALDSTHVYWASNSRVKKLPLDGGGEPIDLVGLQINPQGIAVNGTHVYWTDQASSGPGSVRRVPLDGGEPETMVDEAGPSPGTITLDASHVYWAEGTAADERAVLKAPLEGGTATTLASGAYTVFGLAVDATHVYWTTFAFGSSVQRTTLDGGEAETLATGNLQPMALAADAQSVYWANASDNYTLLGQPGTNGTVMGVSITGPAGAGNAAWAVASSQSDPGAIATNGRTVCWTNFGNDTIACLGACDAGVCQ